MMQLNNMQFIQTQSSCKRADVKRGQPTRAMGLCITLTLLVTALFTGACSSMPAIPGFSGAPAVQTETQPAMQTSAQPPANGSYAPTLTLDPPVGAGGVYVRVSGSGWPANMLVLVALTNEEDKSNTLASVNTDRDGAFSTGFLYPIGERWLTTGTYRVVAATADGKQEALADIRVGAPGTEVATGQESPDSSSGDSLAQQEAQGSATAAGDGTAAQTEAADATAVQLDSDPTNDDPPNDAEIAAQASEPARDKGEDQVAYAPMLQTAGNTPVHTGGMTAAGTTGNLSAGFIPLESKRDKGVYIIHAQVDASLPPDHQLIALIVTPSLDDYRDIKLKRDDDWETKFSRNKVEIEAPDPDALVQFMRAYGGFPVADGQRIEVKLRANDSKMEIEYDDGKLEIEAASVTLKVLIVGPNGPVAVTMVDLSDEQLPPGLSRAPAAVVAQPPAWFGHERRD